MINVTKPFLPPINEYQSLVESIWQRAWLTNNGPLVNELELKLKEYLNINHLLFLGDGTIALQFAIRALELSGKEIITTPFSYVATTSAIVWENCKPVFADIKTDTLNIDPNKIEALITADTGCILATHVYGNPCDVEAIQIIADKYNLKVIYDGAHAFGTRVSGKSIFEFGDISTCSFHATKLFHTIEGGCVITQEPELLKKISFYRNFGHNGPESFEGVGINGKNSEFHAAMGICNLKYINEIIRDRKSAINTYKEKIAGLKVQIIKTLTNVNWNHSYFPVIFESEEILLKSVIELNNNWVYPRRYFYPTLSSLSYVSHKYATPIADDISKRILCLPLFSGISNEEISFIARILLRVQNN